MSLSWGSRLRLREVIIAREGQVNWTRETDLKTTGSRGLSGRA